MKYIISTVLLGKSYVEGIQKAATVEAASGEEIGGALSELFLHLFFTHSGILISDQIGVRCID
jgi:hypothetical protein